MSGFIVGGPGCYGLDVSRAEHAQEWLNGTPNGVDPRTFMTPEESEAFNAHIPHVVLHPDELQNHYLHIGRIAGLQTADEIAGYDAL